MLIISGGQLWDQWMGMFSPQLYGTKCSPRSCRCPERSSTPEADGRNRMHDDPEKRTEEIWRASAGVTGEHAATTGM